MNEELLSHWYTLNVNVNTELRSETGAEKYKFI